jgi:hypothetical protein
MALGQLTHAKNNLIFKRLHHVPIPIDAPSHLGKYASGHLYRKKRESVLPIFMENLSIGLRFI